MTLHQLRRGARLWHISTVPLHTRKHNFRKWKRITDLLGDKWLFAEPVERLT